MRFLVIVSVVLGVALGQGFPRDTPEVQAARDAFIREYNRLAELAERAPDIHIYEQRPLLPGQTRPVPVPAFNDFSFSANLGGNQQFVPGPNTFPSAGHLAGHLAGHHVPAPRPAAPRPAAPQPSAHRFSPPSEFIPPWTGPLADDVPAGVSGRTQDTPNVAAAKAAHFRAHASALGIRV